MIKCWLSHYDRGLLVIYFILFYFSAAVAAKHKETKQFYTLYNTLDDTKVYLEKEVNLL